MAVATTTALLIGGGIALAGGAAKTISGANQAKKSREAFEDYDRQTLRNSAENLRVSRLGADLRSQQLARQEAVGVDALRSGGIRGLAMLPELIQNQATQQQQIAASLDEQQMAVDRAKASGAMQVQSMQEAREQQDLNALSSQYNQGQQQMWSGIGDMTGSVLNTMTGMQGLSGNQASGSSYGFTADPNLSQGINSYQGMPPLQNGKIGLF